GDFLQVKPAAPPESERVGVGWTQGHADLVDPVLGEMRRKVELQVVAAVEEILGARHGPEAPSAELLVDGGCDVHGIDLPSYTVQHLYIAYMDPSIHFQPIKAKNMGCRVGTPSFPHHEALEAPPPQEQVTNAKAYTARRGRCQYDDGCPCKKKWGAEAPQGNAP